MFPLNLRDMSELLSLEIVYYFKNNGIYVINTTVQYNKDWAPDWASTRTN